MRSTIPQQQNLFLIELNKLSYDTQLCLADFLGEIEEVGLGHIGGCPWRKHHQQLLEALPALNVLCPSVRIEKYYHGCIPTHSVRWTPCEFHMPYSPELYLLWEQLGKKFQTCPYTSVIIFNK